MKVERLMSRNPKSCRPDHDLACAAQILWEDDVGCVPIVDSEGRAVAMLTDRDVAMAAYTQGLPLREIRVSQAMSQDLHTCSPTDSVAVAEETMRARQVRRLPVVASDGKLVGVLSMNDIAREAFREREMKKPDLDTREVLGAFASIGAKRPSAPPLARTA